MCIFWYTQLSSDIIIILCLKKCDLPENVIDDEQWAGNRMLEQVPSDGRYDFSCSRFGRYEWQQTGKTVFKH